MFDLEQAISEWRRQMLAANIQSPVPLEELESHLLEDIAAFIAAGKPEHEAFRLATSRLGSPAAVRIEFDKLRGGESRSVKIASLVWLAAVIGAAAFIGGGLHGRSLSPLLYAHIVTLTAGYLAAFLIGSFGICSVCWRLSDNLSLVRQQSLGRAVHLFSHLAAGLVIVGMMLGLPLSQQYFGRYWRWDPKEIGGLCVAIWLIALAAMQRYRRMSDRGTIFMCLGANVIVTLAWFGAGIIDYNQKMHGHRTANCWPLAVFLGIQLCFLIAAVVPSPDKTEMLDAPPQ